MELREFVTETLSQVIEGVKAAQVRAKEHGARVNPHLTTSAELAVKHGILIASGGAAQLFSSTWPLPPEKAPAQREGWESLLARLLWVAQANHKPRTPV